MMTAKELIIKARLAEEMAEKLRSNIEKMKERLTQANLKREEKGFEMKKMEREYEVSGRTDDIGLFLSLTIFYHIFAS